MFSKNKNYKKAILVACIGNFIEIYTYSHFIYLSTILSQVFFPEANLGFTIIYVYLIYVLEKLVRPLSGIVLGHYSDRHGRKKLLNISLYSILVPNVCMIVLPGYSTLGYIAPLLLLTVRIFHGILVANEFNTAIVYLTEQAPLKHKNFYGSLAFVSGILGAIMSTLSALVITYFLPKDSIVRWGWKIPYLISVILILCSWKLSKYILESKDLIKNDKIHIKLSDKIARNWQNIITCAVITALSASTYSLIFVFIPIYLKTVKEINLPLTLMLTTFNLVIYCILMPIAGFAADRFSNKKIIFIAINAILIYTIPFFYFMNTKNNMLILEIAWMTYAVILATLNGSLPTFLSLLFSPRTRSASLAIGYGVTYSIFSGITPLVCIYFQTINNIRIVGILIIVFAILVALKLHKQFSFFKSLYKINYEV